MQPIIYLISLVLLSGCTSQTVQQVPQVEEKPLADIRKRGIDELLLEARRTFPPQSTKLQLEAAEIAILSQNYELANRIIRSIESPYLSRENIVSYSLIHAEVAIGLGNPALAIRLLEDRRFHAIESNQENLLKAGLLRAKAYRMGRSYLASARELIYINKLIPLKKRQPNHEKIFSTLLQLSEENLKHQAELSLTNDVRGWLSLVEMTKRFQHDPLKHFNAFTASTKSQRSTEKY